MLINSSRTSSNNRTSLMNTTGIAAAAAAATAATIDTLPSTIVWTQTIDSITLQININHVHVLLSEQCLKLSNKSKTISLPLFDRVYIDQCDIEQMIMTNNNKLTLKKECYDFWPHLFMQQTDKEIEAHLLQANFLIHIIQSQQPTTTIMSLAAAATNITTSSNTSALTLYDTLDFETVINGQGEKTGLE